MRIQIAILTILVSVALRGFSQTIVPQPLYTPATFGGRTLNTSTAEVGALGGGQTVSLGGAATYTIPIDVPAGRAGLTPSLALVYSSQAGRGLAGYGWNLTGISAITRANKDLFTDGVAEAPVLSVNDAWTLDGNRLMLVSGTPGAAGAVYGTQSESFSRITAVGPMIGSGPTSFLVEAKNGLKYEYGLTADARFLAALASQNHVLGYYLSKVSDAWGNTMSYTYAQDNDQIRVTSIKYGVNTGAGMADAFEVRFRYAAMGANTGLQFWASRTVQQYYALDQIWLLDKGSIFKKYSLEYASEAPSGQTASATAAANPEFYLKSASVETGSSTSGVDGSYVRYSLLNSTVFRYGENASPFVVTPGTGLIASSSGTQARKLLAGDFNGDGKSDAVAVGYNSADPAICTGISFYSLVSGVYVSTAPSLTLPAGSELVDRDGITIGDFNGDGKDDILFFTRQTDRNAIGKVYLYYSKVYSGTGSYLFDFEAPIATIPPASSMDTPDGRTVDYNRIPSQAKTLYTGDFDGDGAEDYVLLAGSLSYTCLIENEGSYELVRYPGGFRTFISYPKKLIWNLYININNNFVNWDEAHHLSVVEYNGDGIADLMLVNTDTDPLKIYDVKSNASYTTAQAALVVKDCYPTNNCTIYPGDFNGDGKTDMLIWDINTSPFPRWDLVFSRGLSGSAGTNPACSQAFYMAQTNVDIEYQPGLANREMLISDLNGDGRSDVLCANTYSPSGPNSLTDFSLFYSKGVGFLEKNHTGYTYHGGGGISSFSLANAGDIDGDGGGDFLAYPDNSYGYPVDIFQFNKAATSHLLVAARDGFNNEVSFAYQTLANPATGPAVYTKGTGAVYPINDIQWPITVVASMTTPDGIGGTQTTTYSYEGAKFYREGRRLLGFTKVTAQNAVQRIKTVTEHTYNATLQALIPYKTTTSLLTAGANNGSIISVSENSQSVVSQPNGRFWIRPNTVVSTNGITGTVSTQTFTYTNPRPATETGNPDQLTATVANASGTIIEQSVQQFSYGTFGTWLADKVTQVSVTNTRLGVSGIPNISTMTYGSNGQLLSQTTDVGTGLDVQTTYSNFDAFGNARTITVTPNSLPARATTLQFGLTAYGLYPTQSTDPLGQTSSIVYNVRYGKPLTITQIDGTANTYWYDTWGRINSRGTTDGNEVSYTYEWAVNAASSSWGQASLYRVRSVINEDINVPGFAGPTAWYDAFGREVRQEETLTNGSQVSITRQEYDARGLLTKRFLPYFTGQTTFAYTLSAYDDYGRPVSSAAYDGLGTAPLTTTYAYAVVNGNAKTTVTDPAGRATEAITDPAGRTLSKKDVANNTLTYTYYPNGQPATIVNGTTTLAEMFYDDAGRQTQLTDPNSGSTFYGYNALGELVLQVDANANMHTMTYDLLGRITQREGPEGITSYEYITTGNGKGQIKKITGFNAGSPITTEYAYNAQHLPATKTETIDGIAYITNYAYDAKGRLDNVAYPHAGANFGLKYEYNLAGDVLKIKNLAGTITLFEQVSQHASGQSETFRVANSGITRNVSFNAFGMATGYTAGTPTTSASSIQSLSWTYNLQTGNITSRTDVLTSRTENFGYDNLDRLTSWQVVGQTANTISYAANSNIQTKTDAGTYTYSPDHIHAVSRITNPSGLVPALQQQIAFTGYHQPATITENNYTATFTDGAGYQRRKMVLKQGTTTLTTRYYLGAYEKDVTGSTTRHLLYVSAPNGTPVAVIERISGVDSYHYLFSDHLGSILRSTTSTGTVEFSRNFDPWGRERNPATWTFTSVPTAPAWAYRGYTGHEHLPQFGLINMNGRLYDPIAGRMLSVDNYVQGAGHLAGFNRYSYAMNNPLRYVDPNGEEPITLTAFALAAGIGGTINLINNWHKVNSWQSGLAYFGVGALGGVTVLASAGNVHAGALVTMAGNLATDVATGHVPKITDPSSGAQWGQFALYSGNLVLGGYTASAAAGGAVAANLPAVAESWGVSWSTLGQAGYVQVQPGVWQYSLATELASSGRIVQMMTGVGASSAVAGKATSMASETLAQSADDAARIFNDIGGKGRVFWSGNGNPAVKSAAEQFARENGMVTLEQTTAGMKMTELTQNMPWDQARPLWENISSRFAQGANGTVHVFQNANGINPASVWNTVEAPLLEANRVEIIFHLVP